MSIPGHAEVLCDTKNMRKMEWLRRRREGIGASDASVVANKNPWNSPRALYHDKIGDLPLENETNEAIEWGNRLEPIVADKFQDQENYKVQNRHAILKHPDYDFILANLDRFIVDPGNWGVLECKTTNGRNWKEWENGAPDRYELQLQHQLAVTGLDWGVLAVLIGGQDFRTYRYDRDDDLIESLINIEERFWDNVLSEEPPPLDGHEATGDALDDVYSPAQSDDRIELDPGQFQEKIERHAELKDRKDEIEEKIEKIENEFKEAIGDNTKAEVKDTKVNYQESSRTYTNVDEDTLKEKYPEAFEECVDHSESSWRSLRVYH